MIFERWCALKGIPPLPALPRTVAAFVKESGLGAAPIWDALQEVSRAHVAAGYADPTLGPPVSNAMNAVTGIEPPRCYPKEDRANFMALPWSLQVCVLRREEERDRALHRAFNEAHAKRKQNAETAAA